MIYSATMNAITNLADSLAVPDAEELLLAARGDYGLLNRMTGDTSGDLHGAGQRLYAVLAALTRLYLISEARLYLRYPNFSSETFVALAMSYLVQHRSGVPIAAANSISGCPFYFTFPLFLRKAFEEFAQ